MTVRSTAAAIGAVEGCFNLATHLLDRQVEARADRGGRHRAGFFLQLTVVDHQDLRAAVVEVVSVVFGPSEGIHDERFGLAILDGVGSTEVGAIYLSNRPGCLRPGSSDKILEGFEARLVTEDGRAARTGEVGVPDEAGLEKPVAFVVLRESVRPSRALEEELKGFARQRLPSYKCPRRVEFVSELPRTTTGKVQRYRLPEAVRPQPTGAR